MFKFGKIPPRSLTSFGVSGLLAEDCKIYYENFFGLQHLGRSSDLICARLSEWGLDELKLRTLLLFSVFEAYRTHSATANAAMKEPITLECGVDAEKIVIGVLFRGKTERPVEGLSERISAGKPQGDFEELIARIHRTADLTVLRVQPGVQLEFVLFMGIPGSMEIPSSHPPLALQIFGDPTKLQKAPPAQEYVELGDVDYQALLETRKPGKTPPSPSGEVLSRQFRELEDAIRVRSQRPVDDDDVTVSGSGDELDDGATRVKGRSDPADDEETRVKGGTDAAADEETRIKGGSGLIKDDVMRVQGGGQPDAGKGPMFLRSLLQKVWPFKKGASQTDVVPGESPVAPAAIHAHIPSPSEADSSKATEALSSLVNDLEKGALQKSVVLLQQELEKVKKENGQHKSKRWMEEMMAELVAEKGRLNTTAKQLTQSVHQKEMEFKRTEALLREELRKQEETLRQRTAALERSKEQLHQTTGNMERLKSASKTDSSEEIQFKQKYELTQKLLTNARSENSKLNDKLEDLRNQLMNVQIGAKNKGSAAHTELNAMRNKYERAAKAFEEMRAAHDQLAANHKQMIARMQSATEKEEKATSTGDAKRLEAAMRQVANNQKEMDKMRLRIEEFQQEELRLKRELHLSQQELRGLKAKIGAASKGGGGGGGGKVA